MTASILGANIYSDIFFVAFKLPNLFRRIFAEGAFSQSFLPSFTASRQKSIFSMAIFTRFMLFLLFFSILVTLFSDIATSAIAVGFDQKTIDMAAPLVAINFYYLDLIFIVTFLASLLQYKEHFATTAFSTALLNIAMIIALLLSQNMQKEDIAYALSYGVLAGGVLQVVAHYYASKKMGLCKMIMGGVRHLKAKKAQIDSELVRFNKSFLPAIFGNSTAQVSAFLDTTLASFLAAGSISYLYYANRIFQLPLAIFAIATATALFPAVSKALKTGNEERALALLSKSFWFLASLLSLSTVVGIILSDEIIRLLFERGEFGQEDTQNTSLVLAMYMIGLVPFGLSKLLSLWLYSAHKQLKAAKIAIYALLANILFALLLVAPMKAPGLALAGTIGGFVLFALTFREFGRERFLAIMSAKKAFYLALALAAEAAILLYLKDMIHAYL